ncbi:ATP-dependent helicase/deoxyribonuclease subunit B [Enterococcus termitis]
MKKFQFDGLLLNDPLLLENLDKSLQAKQSSLIYPIEESAKEIIKPGRRQEDKFVTEPELDALLTHNRSKFIEAGNKVTSGEIELNPAYQGKERIACRFCPFRSVCNFDVMLKENNYNRIETLSKKEVMDRLIENEQKGGANDE